MRLGLAESQFRCEIQHRLLPVFNKLQKSLKALALSVFELNEKGESVDDVA